jgi:hypothetical protein
MSNEILNKNKELFPLHYELNKLEGKDRYSFVDEHFDALSKEYGLYMELIGSRLEFLGQNVDIHF